MQRSTEGSKWGSGIGAPNRELARSPTVSLGVDPQRVSGGRAPSYVLASKPPGVWAEPQLHSCGEAAPGVGGPGIVS